MKRALTCLGFIGMAAVTAHAAPAPVPAVLTGPIAPAPALGLGYTRSTNALSLPCLTTRAVEETVDFDYIYAALDEGALATWRKIAEHPVLASRDIVNGRPAVERVPGPGAPRYRHRAFVGVSRLVTERLANPNAALTPPAAALATDDPSGFFATCGTTFLIRGRRQSGLVAVITYVSSSATPDPAMERALRPHEASKTLPPVENIGLAAFAPPVGWNHAQPADLAELRERISDFIGATYTESIGVVTHREALPWTEHSVARGLLLRGAAPTDAAALALTAGGEALAAVRRMHGMLRW
jgi:hypothetical protein